mgnify:CR=1 FL=1
MHILNPIVEKINYLLRRFDKVEWSGPAWYRVTKATDKGFPLEVTLAHFIAIDLGEAASTEVDGEKLGKLLPTVYKEQPKLKDCYLGLIHSHHGLGAFFSGTDETALLEQAPAEGLFFSTVVAHSKDRFCTAVSYQDQFGFSNYIEGEVETKFKHKSEKSWRDEANSIEEEAKEVPKYGNNFGYGQAYNGYGYNLRNQYGMFPEYQKKEPATTTKFLKGATLEEIPNSQVEGNDDNQVVDAVAELYNKFESNEITEAEFIEKAREIAPDVEPHWWVDQAGVIGV